MRRLTTRWLTPRRTAYAIVCIAVLTAGARTNYLRNFYQVPAKEIAVMVGTFYGDPHPLIVSAESGRTENFDEPMYSIHMTGSFHDGGVSFHCISISALADRRSVFYLGGFRDPAECLHFGPSAEPFLLDWDIFNQ